MDGIKYEHFVKDGAPHQCWFCGKPTKDYRAFEYSQFSTKITGPYSYKDISRTTAVKVFCCEDCCQKFDSYSETSIKIFNDNFAVVAISGFCASFLFAFILGANLGTSVIIALLITVILIGILVVFASAKARHKHKEVSCEMVDRLREHPEVKALIHDGFSRSRD